MSDIKVQQGAVLTIALPGLTAIRIDTTKRLIAIDGISGSTTQDEPCMPDWALLDLRDGTYGDFHRLRDADECSDPDCIRACEHDISDGVRA